MNEVTFWSAMVAALVAIITKVIDALMARRREATSGSIEHRKLLSEDERAFRQAVLDEVKELREDLDRKTTELDELRPKLALAVHKEQAAEQRVKEVERRAQLLESQISDLRSVQRMRHDEARQARNEEDKNRGGHD